MKSKPNYEARYFDALKRITQYGSTDWLRRNAEKLYGLNYEEALEMAYENILQQAKDAIRGKRKPVDEVRP